ncbi:MAG: glycyl-radical enzyme activating protein, partial [Bacteroidota bacterium]
MNPPELKGLIFNILRNSTEDGPGIRTTVFMKGCSMHCPWCHNPEGIDNSIQLVWYDTRCIGDGKCVKTCPREALKLTEKGVVIDRDRCDSCGLCINACPAAALELSGKEYTVKEVTDIVLEDKPFYRSSGGGMTISGGEPALQPEFCSELMKAVKSEKIHISLDTCAGVNWKFLQPLVELADLILLDLKMMDDKEHLRLTGVPLELVLENAKQITNEGKSIWIRTPVIPGYTDSKENIRNISLFIKQNLPTAIRYDLLAFNNYCTPK